MYGGKYGVFCEHRTHYRNNYFLSNLFANHCLTLRYQKKFTNLAHGLQCLVQYHISDAPMRIDLNVRKYCPKII